MLKFLLRDVTIKKRAIPLAYIIWFGFALIAVVAELAHNKINNYLIFSNAFWHLIHQQNLYLAYPQEYFDYYFYGPIFSIIIAPFAALPNWLGVILWVMSNALILFYAIKQLPITEKGVRMVLLISAIEFMTSSHNVQFNPAIAAFIILAYAFVNKQKDFWSTFFIALGFLTKLYGIVGILFFMFSKHKIKFIGSFIFWLIILFCLPMLISSPAYIVQTYLDWANTLVAKNTHNITLDYVSMQDLTVMGMIRRIFRLDNLSNLAVIAPAAILILLPLLRTKLYSNKVYQLFYLGIALITTVIFSSSAESATYVIAMVGVALWYVMQMHKNHVFDKVVLLLALCITSLSATDLCPHYIKKEIVLAYALKALPCFIVWLLLIKTLLFSRQQQLTSPQIQDETL